MAPCYLLLRDAVDEDHAEEGEQRLGAVDTEAEEIRAETSEAGGRLGVDLWTCGGRGGLHVAAVSYGPSPKRHVGSKRVVAALPTLGSPLLARHLTIGCSTGFMADLRNDWDRLVDRAAAVSSMAVELSAVSASELPGLLEYLAAAPRLPFLFVSVHAPSKGLSGDERANVEALRRMPAWVDGIVVHPDTISDPALYQPLGRRLVLENMDRRKKSGHVADDLGALFAELPEARLCFDVAHAKDVDSTMGAGSEMLRRFSSRLSHVHVSSLDESQHHVSLTAEDEALFEPVLAHCRDVPWILEAPPPS